MVRRPRFAPWLAALLAIALTGPAFGTLRDKVDRVLRSSNLGGASVAVSVREAGRGDEILNFDGNAMMIPASNLKLITTGAALDVLGPGFRFRTRLLHDTGTLWVVGDGDPAFGDPSLLGLMGPNGMDVDSFLRLWTDAIVATGRTDFDGIVVDARIFDNEFVHPSWPRDQLNRRYCAEVAGLNFHLNQLHFYPTPRPDERPSLSVYFPYTRVVEIRNNATSRQGVHDDDTAWVARRLDTNDLTVYGNVKHPYRAPVPVTLHDMPNLFGNMLAERLRQSGIAVRAVRVATAADPAPRGDALGPEIFTPIDTVVTRCNRDSQNLYAESLLKRMGAKMTRQGGSWLNGAAIVRQALHRRLSHAGLASRLMIVDGSGLSRENRVAATTMTAWLNAFHNDERAGRIFIDSLAVAGESGTLEKRFRDRTLDAKIVGKSGYINGVSCLSGYVTTPDGQRRCFSIMVNDLDVPVRRAKLMQERIVAAIVEDMAPVPVSLGSD